ENKMRVWITFFVKLKKCVQLLVITHHTEDNVNLMVDFVLKMYNTFIKEDEGVMLESFEFIMDILFIFLRESSLSRNTKTKIIDNFKYNIKEYKILKVFLSGSRFVDYLANLLEGKNSINKAKDSTQFNQDIINFTQRVFIE